jgi:hypothetical protein
MKKTQKTTRVSLRLTPEFRERLQRVAEADHRTLNSEIEMLIEMAFPAMEERLGIAPPKPRPDSSLREKALELASVAASLVQKEHSRKLKSKAAGTKSAGATPSRNAQPET